ncbi:MAG: dipicolinate synthase, partial [Oscillospiraceae bacterium]|nr:dipicolinate synthase [Oscillospiraceae bacterium]
FDRRVLAALPRDAVVIDLASKPGGVDFDTARQMGVKTIWALSLPGKVAPISSGEAIKDTILNILDERRDPLGQ